MASLSTPLAIVLGLSLAGTFSGVGLYFGLRSRGAAPPAVAPPVVVGDVSSVALSSGAAPGLAPAAAPSDAKLASAMAHDEVKAAFDARHARVVTECWEPSVAKNPLPATMSVTLEFGFDANGTQTYRTLREDRTARPDVNACLVHILDMPRVAPPGAPARVRMTVTLP